MNNELRILHLEDNPVDAELVRETLAVEGIPCETVRVETREDFLAAIEKGRFNLILGDYTLPSFDGLAALVLARERCPDVPFIIVSGTMGEEVAIESLKGGATDYVLKGKLSRLGPAVRRALKEAEERSERKRTEGELKESGARYRSLFDNMLDGFAYCRMLFENDRPQDFIYLEVNRAFEELTGLKNVVGKKVTEVIPGIRESSPELFEVYGRVALTGRTERFEIYLEPLGAWLSISVYSTEKEHFIAVFDNITEQKLAEDRIKKIADEWSVTFDSIKDLISVHDKNFRIVRVNKAFADALKMQPEELIGKPCYEVIHKTEEHWPVCPHEMAFGDKKPHTTEFLEPGWGAYFEVSASPILDDKGEITGTVHIIKDITERKKAEEELKRSEVSYKELTVILGDSLTEVKRREESLQKGRDAFLNMLEDVSESYKKLVSAYDTTIEGWSRALDYRDKETEGHSQRVTEITLQIARATGTDEEELVHLRRGALLHDIGKMGVPDNILLKPGKLTDEEWVIMKRHPEIAYELLSPIAFLRPALDIPHCHHEKWDGTGYPRGLRGEQIPLAARIFALVDVWDALRSDRPYRPAWPEERVFEHIRMSAGSHFDPEVVGLFLKVLGKSE